MKISKWLCKQPRRGAAVVEVAVILPILIILTFGAIKYGWLFYRLQQITNITRQAARYAILPSISGIDTNGDTVADGIPAVEGLISSLMDDAGLAGKYDTPEISLASAAGDLVTVTINVPVENVDLIQFKGPLLFIPTPEDLRASVTMSKEGPVAVP